MRGHQFIRMIRRHGRKTGVVVRVERARGKGGHQRLRYGDRWTMVATGSKPPPPGTYHAMLEQLGIRKEDL